ncbi:MAG: hypothetical protein A2W19_11730 [Spirochaetes bacterium RBG_16_49_21]|nr:MAG: hypothetical protein A2W19_11730 [Spirochaetes bacterium RBG_16_49_21]
MLGSKLLKKLYDFAKASGEFSESELRNIHDAIIMREFTEHQVEDQEFLEFTEEFKLSHNYAMSKIVYINDCEKAWKERNSKK